jgi:hypothetical protein
MELTSTSYENPMMASSLGSAPKMPSFDSQSDFVGLIEGTEEGASDGVRDGTAEGALERANEGE